MSDELTIYEAVKRVRNAEQGAHETLRQIDEQAGQLCRLLLPRLRKVNQWDLVDLKRALSKFDSHRKVWK